MTSDSRPEQVKPLLEIDGVSVRFGGVHAVREVSLGILPGEIVAIIGANGAGKSTLLNAICGLVPTTGSIRLAGEELVGRRPEYPIMRGLARSFQDPQLIETGSVMENLLVGMHAANLYRPLDQWFRPGRVGRAETASAARAALIADRIGLGQDLARPVSELTYGARKTVDIARALMGTGLMLILDEPSSGLDLNEQVLLTDVLKRIWDEREISVLIVEHHMEVVDRLAHRVIELQAGEIKEEHLRPKAGRLDGKAADAL
jgi:ABC-type branched-subunit amino acid transport system ATPase component